MVNIYWPLSSGKALALKHSLLVSSRSLLCVYCSVIIFIKALTAHLSLTTSSFITHTVTISHTFSTFH